MLLLNNFKSELLSFFLDELGITSVFILGDYFYSRFGALYKAEAVQLFCISSRERHRKCQKMLSKSSAKRLFRLVTRLKNVDREQILTSKDK